MSNIRRYQQAVDSVGFPSDLPPHTYAIAQKAVSLFHNKKQNQSCIVSGEKSNLHSDQQNDQSSHNNKLSPPPQSLLVVVFSLFPESIRRIGRR